jgi:TetR/AcrR family transcriptional regulator
MNERFNQLPEERRSQIMNGAMQAFAEHGYDKCSVADVAELAGVSKALLFHYFNTKAELYDHLNSYATSLSQQAYQKLTIKPGEDLLEAFAKLVKQRIALTQMNPEAYRFLNHVVVFESMPPAEEDLQVLLKADTRRLRKGYIDTEVVKLLGWVADGFIEEHLTARSSSRKALTDLENWLISLRKMLYKDKHQ